MKGEQGLLTTFRFRDGAMISTFHPECARRFGQCLIKFSVGNKDWEDGVFNLSTTLIHECVPYQCNWTTVRDSYGNLVIVTGMTY